VDINRLELLIPLFVLGFILFFAGMWVGITILLSRIGGWAALAAVYRFPGWFSGERWTFQSAQMRWTVNYSRCLTVGADARGISFSPAGDQAFITSAASSEIAVVSTASDALVGRYTVGQGLRGIAVAPAPFKTLSAAMSQPNSFRLRPGFPNPFNAAIQIPYALAAEGAVELMVYDALGQRVRTLVARQQSAGEYQEVWDGRDEKGREVASGVYVVVLRLAAQQAAQKVLLLR